MRHNTDPGSGAAHTPVMLREVIDFISMASGAGEGILIDCTLGEGGHSEKILRSFPDLRIIGLDRDPEILELARERLKEFGDRIEFINDNFSNVSEHLERYKGRVSGMLYDFGISSYHYDKSGRGFALYKDEPLDMRLGAGSDKDAQYIVNNYSENDLARIFYEFGEERWAKRIAKAVRAARAEKRIKTTAELEEIVFRAIPAARRVKNIHPATRVFQAVRIEVNNELSAIGESLSEAHKYLAPGGIVMAISFHSLEDRIVKNTFRALAAGCTCENKPAACMCAGPPLVRILTKKPLTPADDEARENRRSRSAKLRACMKI